MKTIVIMMLAFMLSGCGVLRWLQQSNDPKQPTEVPIPANLLTRCPDIPNIKDRANMGDLLKYSVDLMGQYNECAVRHDGLVDAVTKKKKD